MVEIGKALNRPPSCECGSDGWSGVWTCYYFVSSFPSVDPCKYFGCELGAQTQMDPKTGRYIVNGAHESSKLQDMLDGFIRKFVLCPECDNPETDLVRDPPSCALLQYHNLIMCSLMLTPHSHTCSQLVNTSKGKIGQTCKACGYHGMIDPRQKLTTFIIKNPPTSGEETPSKK